MSESEGTYLKEQSLLDSLEEIEEETDFDYLCPICGRDVQDCET